MPKTSKENKSNKQNQPRKFYHMMYTQQMKYLPAKTVDKLIELIETRLHPREYALIVHDKDPGQEPHIHCMLSFKNARSLAHTAKLLGENGKKQYIEKWDDRPNNGFAYLIHATSKAKSEGKYQYDPSEIRANFDYTARMAEISADIDEARAEHTGKVNNLLNLLYVGAVSKKEVEQKLSGAQYAQYHKKIEDVWSKRLQNMADAWRAEKKAQNGKISTIWIYGPAGTGKTSLAREYVERSGEEYYISGSSRDIFQGYAGEHKLILDELRPGSIPYPDLLRITDPHGIDAQVMAPSRYYDKALACDLIIVTSPYNPREYYENLFGDNWRNIDKFAQLQRRVALVVKMTDVYISKVEYDRCKKTYEEMPGTARPNPYSALSRPKAAVTGEDIYSAMLGEMPAEEGGADVTSEELPMQ